VKHLMHAICTGRVLLTHNHDDFNRSHELVLLVEGHHPKILVVRRDNDPRRDLRPRGISQLGPPTFSPREGGWPQGRSDDGKVDGPKFRPQVPSGRMPTDADSGLPCRYEDPTVEL
jgi:hypothetical protein